MKPGLNVRNDEQPQIQFDKYGYLACAKCGQGELHHDRVDVYTRQGNGAFSAGEDGPSQAVSVSVKGEVKFTHDAKTNPSSRRHGVRILMWCEQCWAITALTIAQHKGHTLVDVELVLDQKPDTEDGQQDLIRKTPV